MGAQVSAEPSGTPSGMPTAAPVVDLIVLAGGRGERLGGQDKAALVVEGRTLLQRVLAAGPDLGGRVVVVGDTPVPDGMVQTSEEPPGGGPAAGIGAGLDALTRLADGAEPAVWVAVAAVDQPRAAPVLAELRQHLAQLPAEVDALCRRHPDGRRQWLLAIYRRRALVAARARLGVEQGASVRSLVGDMAWREVDGSAEDLGDIDTWEDLARWGGNAPPRVRPASVEDVTAIASVRVAAWLAAYRDLLPQPLLDRLDVPSEAANRRRAWDEQHADARVAELVAEVDGEVVGWAVAGPSRDDSHSGEGELLALYVRLEAWGTGAGHRLLLAAQAHLRAHGFDRAYLWVLEGNERAASFYERHGWYEDGATQLDRRGQYVLTERRRVVSLR